MYATETKVLGRFGRAMIQSQENCLFENHRFTHERWGGDYSSDLSFLAIFARNFYLKGFLRYEPLQGKPLEGLLSE